MSSVREPSTASESSSTFDVGIIGAGWISSAYHLPILDSLDGANVTFVADVERSRARTACRGYDAEPVVVGEDPSVLPACDVVTLAVPVGVRSAYVSEFADRDVAVFAEKPFATDPGTHREYLELADAITCNYMRCQYNATTQLKRVVQSGLFGEPERVELVEEGKTGATGLRKDHFQTDPDQGGGGILMERGCHSLSQVCEIFEGSDVSVAAADITSHERLDAEVEATLDVEFGDSTVEIEYLISRIRPVGSTLVVEFEDGRLEADPFDPESRVSVSSRTHESSGEPLEFAPTRTAATTTHQAMYLRWQSFLSRLAAGDVDSEAETMPLVTELTAEIYEEGT